LKKQVLIYVTAAELTGVSFGIPETNGHTRTCALDFLAKQEAQLKSIHSVFCDEPSNDARRGHINQTHPPTPTTLQHPRHKIIKKKGRENPAFFLN